MGRDIQGRIQRLNARRRGTDRLERLTDNDRRVILEKSAVPESYQKRSGGKTYTQYALGAMQAVEPDYTRISIEEAERVAKQLKTSFDVKQMEVEFRLQGSVPCDIHIRGVSDVDLLIVDRRHFTYDATGIQSAKFSGYGNFSMSGVEALRQIRTHSTSTLRDKFPQANVDTSGSKAIKISGGSLRRQVDVVPSHWHETSAYQRSADEIDRGIKILDNARSEMKLNLPFKHIHEITRQDNADLGGLKKSIRLCKNIKADNDSEGSGIALTSFDIASLMYHADHSALRSGAGNGNELTILAETQRHLDALYQNRSRAAELWVPDGTRKILDSESKFSGLLSLSTELDDLIKEVAKEQVTEYQHAVPYAFQARDELRKIYIPMVY